MKITMNKHIFSERGYTLVELLAVMVILGVIGTIVATILVSSLRGSNRSSSVNQVRDAGNFAISQISKTIAFSMSFNGVSSDGINFNTNCVQPTPPPAPTPTPTPAEYPFVRITSFDGGQTTYSCLLDGSGMGYVASVSAAGTVPLTDSSVMNASPCYFTCVQDNLASPPVIDINFTLKKINSGGVFTENNVSIPFETSVTPRNSGD